MTDTNTVSTWIAGYERAWASNDPEGIHALFTPDAVYLTAPFSEPRIGADAIVSGWLEDQDSPEGYSFSWSVAGLDGDLAFVEGETTYHATANQEGRVYSNLWVIRFAGDGRATSFTEWYMRQSSAGGPGSLG